MKNFTFMTNFDVVQFDNFTTSSIKNTGCTPNFTELQFKSLYSSFQIATDQELSQQTNGYINTELVYADFTDDLDGNNRHGNLNEETMTTFTQETVVPDPGKLETVKGLEHYVPTSSMLHRLREKKVNLILLATSLDEDKVMKKLEYTLDPKTSSVIPLSLQEDIIGSLTLSDAMSEEPETDLISASPGKTHGCNDESSGDETSNSNECPLKRKRGNDKDEKYWKRRNSNNEAAKRSREAKSDRFLWIENRTNELEVENGELQKQLETLRSKLSNLQVRLKD